MKMSNEIEKLAAVLSKLQGEITDAHKDKKGYGYNYADLSQVLDIVRPLLTKYKLSVSQLLYSKEEKIGVETILMHESGQWISSKASMTVERGKGMSLAQSAGSVVTYLRRYALAAIIGICQTDNDAKVEVDTKKIENNEKVENITHFSSVKNANITPLMAELSNLIAGNEQYASIVDKTMKKYKVKTVNQLSSDTLNLLINHMTNSGKEATNV